MIPDICSFLDRSFRCPFIHSYYTLAVISNVFLLYILFTFSGVQVRPVHMSILLYKNFDQLFSSMFYSSCEGLNYWLKSPVRIKRYERQLRLCIDARHLKSL